MPRQKRAQGQSINMTKEEGADLHGKREGGESHQPEWQQRPQDEA